MSFRSQAVGYGKRYNTLICSSFLSYMSHLWVFSENVNPRKLKFSYFACLSTYIILLTIINTTETCRRQNTHTLDCLVMQTIFTALRIYLNYTLLNSHSSQPFSDVIVAIQWFKCLRNCYNKFEKQMFEEASMKYFSTAKLIDWISFYPVSLVTQILNRLQKSLV